MTQKSLPNRLPVHLLSMHTNPHYPLAAEAARLLQSHGYRAYLVGGAVRDMLLGKTPKDFDLVTSATPQQIASIAAFQKTKYKDTAQAYGITRVHMYHNDQDGQLEIATFRKDLNAHLGRKATKIAYASLKEDLSRRDFTINALALDPTSGEIIDYVHGLADLENKIIRFIGEPSQRIKEDPLRIMRAIRFKNSLYFSYDPQTYHALKTAVQNGRAEEIATDRLRDELTKLLQHPSRRNALEDLDDLGILTRVLPEVTAGKHTPQPPQYHAEGSVWDHQLLILEKLPPQPSLHLTWAALLHDIGKAVTVTEPHDPQDRLRFNRHYAVGAELAKTILRRLHFSKRDTDDICWIIYHHMGIDDIPNMRPSHRQKMLGHRAFADLLAMHKADAAASWRPGHEKNVAPEFPELDQLWREYQTKTPEKQQPSLKRDLGIDGNWILANFGQKYDLKPGPDIGRILHILESTYRDTNVTDITYYLHVADQNIKSFNHS